MRLKKDIVKEVRTNNFQYGSVRKTGMIEVIRKAQEWLDRNHSEDLEDENVVLVTDLLAAYDSVPHEGVVQSVKNLMGAKWAASIKRVVEAQSVTITFYEGFSAPLRLGRGLLQGSALSVLLYLLYTSRPPPGLESSRAYVDDITSLSTRGNVERDLNTVRKWAVNLQMDLAWEKTTVIARSTFSLVDHTGRTKTSTTSSRLLGACVHGNKNTKPCIQNSTKIERFCRVLDLITSSRYTPTKRKVEQYKCYALPTLSLHALSKCFDPKDAKLNAACGRLIPKHPHGKGIQHFATSPHGYGRTPIVDYTEAVRTYAHLVTTKYTKEEDLPAKGFTRRSPHKGEVPMIHLMRQQLLSIPANSDLVVATDGGYREADNTGTIGLCIAGVPYGAKVKGKCLSSTHAELAAAVAMASVLKDLCCRFTSVVWWCDSRNAIAQQATSNPHNPASWVLNRPGTPQISWAKGHAANAHINAADAAATDARNAAGVVNVEMCLAMHEVPFICVSADADVVQLTTPMQFVSQVKSLIRESMIIAKIREQCPAECTDRKKPAETDVNTGRLRHYASDREARNLAEEHEGDVQSSSLWCYCEC